MATPPAQRRSPPVPFINCGQACNSLAKRPSAPAPSQHILPLGWLGAGAGHRRMAAAGWHERLPQGYPADAGGGTAQQRYRRLATRGAGRRVDAGADPGVRRRTTASGDSGFDGEINHMVQTQHDKTAAPDRAKIIERIGAFWPGKPDTPADAHLWSPRVTAVLIAFWLVAAVSLPLLSIEAHTHPYFTRSEERRVGK